MDRDDWYKRDFRQLSDGQLVRTYRQLQARFNQDSLSKPARVLSYIFGAVGGAVTGFTASIGAFWLQNRDMVHANSPDTSFGEKAITAALALLDPLLHRRQSPDQPVQPLAIPMRQNADGSYDAVRGYHGRSLAVAAGAVVMAGATYLFGKGIQRRAKVELDYGTSQQMTMIEREISRRKLGKKQEQAAQQGQGVG